ncbi:hypothetical protein D3C86_2217220 [compost metagenome]
MSSGVPASTKTLPNTMKTIAKATTPIASASTFLTTRANTTKVMRLLAPLLRLDQAALVRN